MKRALFLRFQILLAAAFLLSPAAKSYAKEITVVFSGSTHGSLYHCDCPVESDGGVARRATLIKKLRKDNPGIILVDSGSFFAGGSNDRYGQDVEIDKARSIVNLRAMELMQYDGVAITDDEFNFGRDFLESNISKTKLNFLSSNIATKQFGYIIKETQGVRVGVIALTNLSAMQNAGGLEFINPKVALKKALTELNKKGVQVVILLSNLGYAEDENLLKDTPGVNIVISSASRNNEEPLSKIGNVLYLRPFWQGRRLSKFSFDLSGSVITKPKVEELRLSDKLTDDSDISKILPKCFYSKDCKKPGFAGVCLDAGTLNAGCKFTLLPRHSLQIVQPRSCRNCKNDWILNYLKGVLPNLKISYIYYPGRAAERLIRDTQAKSLPLYLLNTDIEKEARFKELEPNLKKQGRYYVIKPEFSGFGFFPGRNLKKGRLDLFLSLYNPNTAELIDAVRAFKPNIHFLAHEAGGIFEAKGGNPEIEEYLRSVCVQKYYPNRFFDYISCRAKNINSSWWENCLEQAPGVQIRTCAQGEEGKKLLSLDVALNNELGIAYGPTYLLDNQEIFSSEGKVSKESLQKILKR